MTLAYGDAYRWDGQNWRYAFNNEKVPNATYFVNDDTGHVELNAPELLCHQMVTLQDVALLLDIEPASVSRMMHRGDIPKPQYRNGHTILWSRPVLAHWRKQRPGRGANLRKGA